MAHTDAHGPPRGAEAHPARVAAGPVPVAQRVLAPDLARGVMLLVIALAHAHLFATFIGGDDAAHTAADRVATAGTVMFVDFRGYPMFAALFGYGLAQIYRRRIEQGHEWPWVRSLLRRRARWLIVFGLLHVLLLFLGDILAVYGLVALVFVGVLRFRDRTLVLLALAWLPFGAIIQAVIAADEVMTGESGRPPMPEGFLDELLFRVTMFGIMGVAMFISTVTPFLLGILAARHRLLEEPAQHLRLLRFAAVAGISVGVLGGLPFALGKTGVWESYSALDALVSAGLHQVTGYAAGLGYAALIALIAVRLAGREGPVTTALAALGQRSLTFYLAQSVVWAVLFASYTFHLQLTSPAAAVPLGVAVWLATVVLADLMRRRGMRGPAEVALRRLSYREGS
ncbi:Uncharacterized membrane protein YeiB [Rhodococcus triatomae]|uniref:Uncharacterized membrane protein YeiB n=1 Tax=Rhodococcus triatomae TaxID=300028 RepID=A0A1G8SNM0_9NOCA|nr:DUF418 domain-containing protein [Rhodococcus triatomae]SDJ30832.1 Uncharacterized membrane protein YeiB [Rhodococcus triatomae]